MSDKLFVTNTRGDLQEVALTPGMSLMEHLRDAGYEEIAAMCGGCCSCATCHVRISSAQMSMLPPVEEDEEMLLTMADDYLAAESRLSCQVILDEKHAGLKVQLVEPE